MNCPHCNRPLIKIDYYGEVLVGCIDCNRWGRPGDETLVLELTEAVSGIQHPGRAFGLSIAAAQLQRS